MTIDIQESVHSQLLTKPAVGLIATADNADRIVRSALRAEESGYHVFIIHSGEEALDAVQLARTVGATVLSQQSGDFGGESSRTLLTRIARSYGFPGLIFHENADSYIDFEASADALTRTTDYGIESLTRSERAEDDGSVVLATIPAYQEENTIEQVVSEAFAHADQVLVVDDGSEDETGSRAAAAGADVVRHERNQGYGGALKTAFREARRRNVDHLVVLDGDGQHDATDIERLVAAQEETDADIVIGSRYGGEQSARIPLYRRFGLSIVNALTNLSIGRVRRRSWIRDTQSGFRAYDRNAIESLAGDETIGDEMNASTDILFHAHRRGHRIEEVGTDIRYDVENASTVNPLSHGLSLVNNILTTVERRRPVTILGVPGLASILVGLGFGYWTVTNLIYTGTFPLGLALVSTLFLLVGLFACFTSIILHSLNTSLEMDRSATYRRP